MEQNTSAGRAVVRDMRRIGNPFKLLAALDSVFCAAVCGICRPNRLCWRFVSLGAQAAAISVFSF